MTKTEALAIMSVPEELHEPIRVYKTARASMHEFDCTDFVVYETYVALDVHLYATDEVVTNPAIEELV